MTWKSSPEIAQYNLNHVLHVDYVCSQWIQLTTQIVRQVFILIIILIESGMISSLILYAKKKKKKKQKKTGIFTTHAS